MHTPSDTSCSSPVSRCPSGMRRSFQADFVLLLRALRADAGDAHQSAPSSSGGGLQNAPCGGDDSKRRQTPPPPLHTHTHTHTRHGRFSCCSVSAEESIQVSAPQEAGRREGRERTDRLRWRSSFSARQCTGLRQTSRRRRLRRRASDSDWELWRGQCCALGHAMYHLQPRAERVLGPDIRTRDHQLLLLLRAAHVLGHCCPLSGCGLNLPCVSSREGMLIEALQEGGAAQRSRLVQVQPCLSFRAMSADHRLLLASNI